MKFKIIINIVFIILLTGLYTNNMGEYTKEDIHADIIYISNFYNIPESIFYNLIKNESNFNYKVKSKINSNGTQDLGLMQFNSKYINYFSERYNNGKKLNPFNPKESMLVGARYLKHLYDLTGSWEKAIMAYNCGLSRVKNNTIPSCTIDYVQRIMIG